MKDKFLVEVFYTLYVADDGHGFVSFVEKYAVPENDSAISAMNERVNSRLDRVLRLMEVKSGRLHWNMLR